MSEYMLLAIVPMGSASRFIQAAKEGGALGGTVLRARGADDTAKAPFHFRVEPEEEIILIKAKKDVTESVCRTVNEEFERAGSLSGTVFILPVAGDEGLLGK